MQSMFENADSFNADISQWNVSSATTTQEMFKLATSFNRNLCAWPIQTGTDTLLMFASSGCNIKNDPDPNVYA